MASLHRCSLWNSLMASCGFKRTNWQLQDYFCRRKEETSGCKNAIAIVNWSTYLEQKRSWSMRLFIELILHGNDHLHKLRQTRRRQQNVGGGHTTEIYCSIVRYRTQWLKLKRNNSRSNLQPKLLWSQPTQQLEICCQMPDKQHLSHIANNQHRNIPSWITDQDYPRRLLIPLLVLRTLLAV